MLIAIHQPNFFPWAGYFHKILISDKFIILDDVQFQKKGGTYGNRVQLSVSGEKKWVTMPVDRSYHGFKNINEVKINNRTDWRKKILGTITINYKKTPFYGEVFPVIKECIDFDTELLSEYNIYAIRTICKLLKIDKNKFCLSSEMKSTGTSTDRLISLTKQLGGDAYLCGGGAVAYQEDEKFASSEIKLVYQNFIPPEYPQVNVESFTSGLSIIDMLFNCGVEESMSLLKTSKIR